MDEKRFLAQTLRHPLHITQVISAFYSDLGQDFISRGEIHDFWEFVYAVSYTHLDVYKRQILSTDQLPYHNKRSC